MKEIKMQFDLQTRLFNNVIVDLEMKKDRRPNDFTNHVSWLAGHLVSTRFMLANLMGAQIKEPHPGLFEHGKGIDADREYPDLKGQQQAFLNATDAIIDSVRKY